ncbi:hypothetical protein Aperf_G00000022520 [Anoplocephala perfoliata]
MDGEGRYTRSWKCQVSVGELYRWILAKLSDKDIKRALHKYRDLMPRQSDWNRKLTQATNVPELGFRYLYRCGQIDETNHRTMQKMLKYIDRQDVLPYFDTILYNTNNANCSIEELQKLLLDRVDVFLQASSALTEEEVHPEPPYEIQCQSLDDRRVTRSLTKRKSCDPLQYMTFAKRARNRQSLLRNDSQQGQASQESASSHESASTTQAVTASCGQVNSAIKASTLSGPVLQTIFNSSLVNMLNMFQMPPSPTTNTQVSSSISNLSNFISSSAYNTLLSGGLLNHTRLPTLVPMVRFHFASVRTFRPPELQLPYPVPLFPSTTTEPRTELFQRQIMLCGGVGITGSENDSLIHYFCRIRMRIKLDLGSSRESLQSVITSDRHDPFMRQMDIFLQAANFLRNRNTTEFCCTLRFNRLDHLEAFWSDYTSGALKKLLMANLLSSDRLSLVGHGSWLVNEDPNTNQTSEQGLPQPGPSRRQSASRRSRVSTGGRPPNFQHSSRVQSPLEELQRALLSVRRHLHQFNIAEPPGNAGQAAQNAAVTPALWTQNEFGAFINNPHGRHQQVEQPQPNPQPPVSASDFDINIFVPRLEYENGRMLLMRNERAIPSLCRLVAASQFVSPAAAPSNSLSASSVDLVGPDQNAPTQL